MFAAEEITVDAEFGTAIARLTQLIQGGAMHAPSEAAYEEGLAIVRRVGPFGSARGLSKLVRVRLLEPIRRGQTLSVPLRWEATGSAGELFPVLDADLILARHGNDQVLLGMAGTYRPPFGRAGAVLDRAIMHRIATATIRTLLEGLAEAISDAVADEEAQPQPRPGGAPWSRTVLDTQEP
jgi:hypothetical protein